MKTRNSVNTLSRIVAACEQIELRIGGVILIAVEPRRSAEEFRKQRIVRFVGRRTHIYRYNVSIRIIRVLHKLHERNAGIRQRIAVERYNVLSRRFFAENQRERAFVVLYNKAV